MVFTGDLLTIGSLHMARIYPLMVRARPIHPQKSPEIEFRSGPSVKSAAAPSAAGKHPAVAPLMSLPGTR